MLIRTRLAVAMSALFVCVVGALGVVVYEVTHSTVLAEIRSDVLGRASSANAVLASRPETPPDAVVAAIASDVVLVELTDAQGSRLAASAGVEERRLAPDPAALPEGVVVERRVDDRPLYLAARRVALPDGDGYVVVARTPQPAYDALGRLRAVLVPAVLAAAVLAAAVAWWSVRRSLAPLTRLVTAAEAIARHPDDRGRVGADDRSDEIGRLATTIDAMLAALERSHHEAAAAHGAQRRFLTDVSHELRAPLTIMQSSLDLAERIGPTDPGFVDQVLSDVRSEVGRMSRRVTQLLMMARTGAESERSRRPLLVGDLVGEVCRWWSRGDPRVTYECAAAPADTVVSGDADQLRQVFEILLDNACRYTGDTGSVRVDTRAGDSAVVVTVADTGAGIAAEELPRIFDRSVGGNGAGWSSGLGVGLSIAQHLVTEHGGTIAAQSEPGRGSRFSVRLSRADGD